MTDEPIKIRIMDKVRELVRERNDFISKHSLESCENIHPEVKSLNDEISLLNTLMHIEAPEESSRNFTALLQKYSCIACHTEFSRIFATNIVGPSDVPKVSSGCSQCHREEFTLISEKPILDISEICVDVAAKEVNFKRHILVASKEE